VIFAVDVEAAGQVLRAGGLTCPGCGGALRVWARARTRRVHAPGGRHVELTPDRGLCRGCGTSQVIVPAWYVPRRAYTVEVIGAVLLGGADKTPLAVLAERVGVPAGTVARWLRGVRRSAVALIRHAVEVGGTAVGADRSPASWLGSDLAEALDALGDAARAFARAAIPAPVVAPTPGRTGIDYLRLVATEHHRTLRDRLNVADPTGALPSATPWHLVNLITAGRGLLTAPRH
jgi:hypothetical protein